MKETNRTDRPTYARLASATRTALGGTHRASRRSAPVLDTADRAVVSFLTGFDDDAEGLTCINGCCVGTHCERAPLRGPLPANAAERWAATMPSAAPVATVVHAETPVASAPAATRCVTGWQEARCRAAVTALAIATVVVLWHWVAAR